MARQGTLLVLSGPSGVGKTTIARKLRERPGFVKITTYTTRSKRKGEENGRDYHFLDRDLFREYVKGGKFLEHAEIHGEYYGTPRREILEELEAGRIVVLDIDVQGARAVRDAGMPAVLIFLAPPDGEELRRRIEGRKTESAEAIQRRIGAAEREMKEKDWFDRIVINQNVERTTTAVVEELRARGHE